jgi:hypothetical protein
MCLVVTDPRCNKDKRDFLAAADHVDRWRKSRSGGATSRLADIAKSANWETHAPRTVGAVRSIYLRMSGEQKLRLLHERDVGLDVFLEVAPSVIGLSAALPVTHIPSHYPKRLGGHW